MKTFIQVLLIIFTAGLRADQGWPQYWGPNRDGTVAANGLFEDEVALERIWIQPLGSGFSEVVVGGSRLFAMHQEGDRDALTCFDAATGSRLWSFPYGPTFGKVGSSEPGPSSTPILEGDQVYGLGAHGELFCLAVQTGKPLWTRNLVQDLGAQLGTFGMISSPLIRADLLILNVGDGKDKAIVAFNKTTGELAWHLGGEKISYHSPFLVNLRGRSQLVAMSDGRIRGLDPQTGQPIWEDDVRGTHLILAGEDLLLLDNDSGFTLYHLVDELNSPLSVMGSLDSLSGTSGKTRLREIWRNDFLHFQYNMPVYHQGFLYGFKGEFLTCLGVGHGEKVWSTREVPRGMLILVDGHLAIISQDGILRIVRATEKGYEERASTSVFEKSGLTKPSYSDGVFYMRSFSHLAAVRVKSATP